jgi:Bacterial Ig-like domain (group 3)/FG-GAP-like repeat/Abnormal spindle-like microcephaly-assoc'd, ASPM-SPD-2-Hydin/FG-GAP repeat
MKSAFCCLLLAATCLSSQSPAPSATPGVLSGSRGAARRVHRPRSVKPLTSGSSTVAGSIDCNGNIAVTSLDFASDDISVEADPNIGSGPLAILDPTVQVANISCGGSIDPNNGDPIASVGSETTNFVYGSTSISATCVVATGACSGSVSGRASAYSLLPGKEQGPLLGSLNFSATSTDAYMSYTVDPGSGMLLVYELSGDFTGTGQESVADPVPQVNTPVLPMSVLPGSSGFTLTVNGSGFVPQSIVNWNGSPLPTSFVTQSQLTTTISSSNVVASGTALITVSNPSGGVSNPASLSITNPTLSISLDESDFSVDTMPESIVTGDFNRDGIPDLAVASYAGVVSVLIGNGDGTFRGSVDYPSAVGARGMIVGDFNGDGVLDLATANQNSGTVSILLGNGDGTFQGHVDYSTGGGPFSLVAGDFNNDGALDLAVVNQNANQVAILLGFGNGTFDSPVFFATGHLPFGIVTGDFNGDGQLDLAIANYSDNTLSILLGNGDGTFGTQAVFATSVGPEMLATADLNGDGKLDLAVGTNQKFEALISILLGNGNGTFQTHSDFPSGNRPRSLVPGDFNGDGKIDLAVANYGSSSVSLLLGKGDGSFSTRTDYPTGEAPQFISLGDFAGTGRLGVAVAAYGSNTASVLLQVPVVALSPSSLGFGGQEVGTTSAPQTINISNTGSAPLNVNNISVQGDFAQSNTCGTNIQPGSDCTISVTFTPTASGTQSGSLTIADNAVGSPQTVSLSGTGTIATTTDLHSSLDPSKFGESVALTAVIVPALSGTPTGSVTFYDGAAALGSVTLNKGMAMLTISSLTGGSHSLTASYPGDGTFGASKSASLNQVVKQVAPSITLISTPNPSNVNQIVAFLANMTGVNGVAPTGSVNLQDGATVLGTVQIVNGAAAYSTSFSSIGTDSITAVYSGDSNYLGTTSKALKQVVSKYTSDTTAASNLNPSSYGQAVNLTSQVTSAASNAPTGTVTFKNGTSSLGTVPLVNGAALLTKSNLPAGTLSITAIYSGDSLNNKSTSPVLDQVVTQATTTTTVTSSPNPSAAGANVKLKATVVSPIVVPVGTVTFTTGTTTLGVVSLAGGKAMLTTSALPVGTAMITATYNGTANIAGSAGTVVQTVK